MTEEARVHLGIVHTFISWKFIAFVLQKASECREASKKRDVKVAELTAQLVEMDAEVTRLVALDAELQKFEADNYDADAATLKKIPVDLEEIRKRLYLVHFTHKFRVLLN